MPSFEISETISIQGDYLFKNAFFHKVNEFAFPICQERYRGHYQNRVHVFFTIGILDSGNQSQNLHGFAKPHVIGEKYPLIPCLPVLCHPANALFLIGKRHYVIFEAG